MTLDVTQQLQAEATENMGTREAVTQTPTNTRKTYQGEIAITSPTYAVTVTATIAQHLPPVYQATHNYGTLSSPMCMVVTAMRKIALETQIKNAREIFNFLNTQGSDLQYLNREDTLFAALLSSPGTQQVKVVYGTGLVTAGVG